MPYHARVIFPLFLAIVIGPGARESAAQAASAVVNVASERRILVTEGGRSTLMAASDSGGTVLGANAKTTPVSAVVPGRSPYVGAQVGYAFGDDSKFASNLVASGSILYSIIESDLKGTSPYKFFLPVRGNIAALTTDGDTTSRKKKTEELVTSAQGMRVAIEPYVVMPDLGSYIHPVLVTSAGWKLNATKDKTDTTRYLALGRLSTGLEFGIGPADGSKLPLTIDLNWVYSAFASQVYKKVFGDDAKARIYSGEFTIVAPVGQSAAFLTEAVVVRNARPVWRLGLVFVASGKSS